MLAYDNYLLLPVAFNYLRRVTQITAPVTKPSLALLENKDTMGESNTLLYVIAAFVILHIVAGIGYLVYKISTAPVSETPDEGSTD